MIMHPDIVEQTRAYFVEGYREAWISKLTSFVTPRLAHQDTNVRATAYIHSNSS